METEASERMNPRTRRVHQLVFATALEILFEEGADQVTAVRVSERSEVARSTIYRYWPDQESLLLASIDSLSVGGYELPIEDDLEVDVRAALQALANRVNRRKVRHLYGALGAHAATSEPFAAAQRRLVEHLTAPTCRVLELARERGDLPADLDCGDEATSLVAPILHRYFSLHLDPDEILVEAVAARWLETHT